MLCHFSQWLDDYMEKILLNEINFDYEKEDDEFNKLFSFLEM
jgi:hypothetical protein